jgi:choline dehydrogenase-like flavoprotein
MAGSGIAATYVIVGAGSAGCVLANRLSADPKNQVVLLEAGGDDRPFRNLPQFFTNMMIHIPSGITVTLNDKRVNWMYETEADAGTKGRKHGWPRGKILGGSSSINGLFYIRGQHADYDGWRQLGCDGWSAQDVLPYFKRAERQQSIHDDYHGIDGPLSVSGMDYDSPITQAIIDACIQVGLPYNPDVNGVTQEGVGRVQVTAHGGKRCSTAVAYLHPVIHRPNLTVITNALASRVLFQGRRASGIEYNRGGETKRAMANAEVILCGGTVNSPQLLELSGIGRADVLGAQGIDVLVESPNVGENMQDHFMVGMQWRLKPGTHTINELAHGTKLLGQIAKYITTGRGLPSFAVAQSVAFARSREGLDNPDIQYHFMPATMDLEKLYDSGSVVLEKLPGMTISPCQLRPDSRGSIHIKSADFRANPAIIPNYLSTESDQQVLLAALRQARDIVAGPALARYVDHAITPKATVHGDEELLDHARTEGGSGYHPVGTCHMGGNADSVVDPQLRVRGVDGLRVADASIMPRLISGNTNAPTIMIAEKAADLILGKNKRRELCQS